MNLKVGDKAPDFYLPDSEKKFHRLSDYKDMFVLLYFYPKDDTPGCIKEACAMRDSMPQFDKLNIAIVGVSADSQESHIKFAEKYNLNFTLLSDEDKVAIGAYGVWQKKKMMGREYMGIVRNSFLIDASGKIAKIYSDIKPASHAEEVLADLAAMKKN